jgi:hypothetical protein
MYFNVGRNDWYRLHRYLEIGLMQSTDITAQDPTSTSTSTSSSSSGSSTELDCDGVTKEHVEHSLKRVREEESSGGESVGGESRTRGSDGNVEEHRENRESNAEGEGERGVEGADHSSNSLLTGTFTCTYIPRDATLHFLNHFNIRFFSLLSSLLVCYLLTLVICLNVLLPAYLLASFCCTTLSHFSPSPFPSPSPSPSPSPELSCLSFYILFHASSPLLSSHLLSSTSYYLFYPFSFHLASFFLIPTHPISITYLLIYTSSLLIFISLLLFPSLPYSNLLYSSLFFSNLLFLSLHINPTHHYT